MSQLVLQFSTSVDRPANWASALIRRMCHSPFSHIDIVLKDGSLLGVSDSPAAPVLSGSPRGVAIRPTDYQEFGTRRRMVIDTDKADEVIGLAKDQLGKPFDSAALHDFFSDSFPGARDWRDNGSWFCAELIVWALETADYWGPIELMWPKNRISPTDIFLLFMFDHNWSNRATFWAPIDGIKLGTREH